MNGVYTLFAKYVLYMGRYMFLVDVARGAVGKPHVATRSLHHAAGVLCAI